MRQEDPGGPAVRPVVDATELQEVYAVLLAPSFPPRELVPADWLIEGAAAGSVSVLVAEDASGPVAVAVTEPRAPSAVVLLTYFATRADQRGRGVGSALFGRMLETVVERQRPHLVVAEVERPDRHAGSPEFGDPTARLRFYGRHGAKVLDLPYFQPPIGDQAPVHGMLLLALWVAPGVLVTGAAGGEAVPGGLLAPFIESALDRAGTAGQAPPAHRLREAAGEPTISLWPVADYHRVTCSEPDPLGA